jgi:hypothetical protein
VLIEKPIDNAIPKNRRGERWVTLLVAKNIPITRRVVAMPRRTAIARVIDRNFSRGSRRRCHAQNGENRNKVLKNSTFHPTANGIMAHRVGSNTNHYPEKKQRAFEPCRASEPSKVDKWSQNDKSQCRNNMYQRESCMRRKGGVERCKPMRSQRQEACISIHTNGERVGEGVWSWFLLREQQSCFFDDQPAHQRS